MLLQLQHSSKEYCGREGILRPSGLEVVEWPIEGEEKEAAWTITEEKEEGREGTVHENKRRRRGKKDDREVRTKMRTSEKDDDLERNDSLHFA